MVRILVSAVALVLAAAPVASAQTERVVSYRCASGARVVARYLGTRAVLAYRNRSIPMHAAISADGGRYTGANMQWWTKGRSATLSSMTQRREIDRCLSSAVATLRP